MWRLCKWDSDAPDSYKWACEDGAGGILQSYTKMVAARLFITMASILSTLSILSIISILLVDANSKQRMALTTKFLSIGSLVVGIISLGLGINYVITLIDGETDPTEKVQIYTASILAILAVVFNLIGAIATLMIKFKNNYSELS